MLLWQTLRSTFTSNLCLLPLIKNAESRIELPLSNRLGVFSFCPGWKSFHIPFLRGQRSASALPACPPWLPHAEWLVLTPYCLLQPYWATCEKGFRGFVRFCLLLMAPSRKLNQSTAEQAGSPFKTMISAVELCGCRSCFTKLYEQTKYRKWVHHPELRWQQPRWRGEEEKEWGVGALQRWTCCTRI